MKKLFKTSESALLTLVTLCAMYFLGSFLVYLFKDHVLPLVSLWQDDTTAVFSVFASVIPVIPAKITLKEVKEIKPLPFEVETKQTTTGKNAYALTFKDNQERNIFLGLCRMANILTFNYGFSKDHKTGIIGLLQTATSEKFVKDYNSMTANKAIKLGAESLEERKAAKEAKKAEKAANKGSKQSSGKGIGEQVAKLDIALERGLITKEEHSDKLKAILLG